MSVFANLSLCNLTDTAVAVMVAAIPVGGTIITAIICGILLAIGCGLKKYCEHRYKNKVADRGSMGSRDL